MAKIFLMMIVVVFSISLVGLGVAQVTDVSTGSSPIIVASGKSDDHHGNSC